MKEENIIAFVFFVLATLLVIAIFFPPNWLKCEGEVRGEPELYYYKSSSSNTTDAPYTCEIGNKTKDKLLRDEYNKEHREKQLRLKQRKECYDNGKNKSFKFDLIKDYNFTCEKIKYINNHFIDKLSKNDGGSQQIMKTNSGLFSYSKHNIKIKFNDWIVMDSLPTDQILKRIDFHLDCDNETLHWKTLKDTTHTEFYTTSDFVMYYTNNCLGDA